MSEYLGYETNSDGGPRNYWKVPKNYDPRAMLFCKKKEIKAQALNGRLLNIEAKEGEYEGNPTYQLQLTFEGDVNNVFQCGRYSLIGRDIILKLATVDEIHFVKIFPFESEFDGKKLVRCSVRAASTDGGLYNAASKLQPAFKADEMPAVQEVIVNKKKVMDTGARDEFIDSLIPAIQAKIAGAQPYQKPVASEMVVEEIEPDKF